MVEDRVYEALKRPIVGHLDPFFFEVVDEIRARLKPVFGSADGATLVISATGSGGMETCIANFVEPGCRFAVLANGYFCDRITEMARRYGAQVVRLEKPWGEAIPPDEAAHFIARHQPDIVAFVQAETSTGVYQPGAKFAQAAHAAGALVLADVVTSLGAMPVEADRNGIDIAYSCTQKGLSCPPGLSPIFLSRRALEKLHSRKSTPPSWYFDLRLLEEYYDAPRRYHHTAPISLFYALLEGLRLIEAEGLESRWMRHRRHHLALVAGLQAMGLELLVAEPHRLWNLITPRVPSGIDDAAVRRHLLQQHGVDIAGGFGPLAGKIFRIGLMGPLASQHTTLLFLDAFEAALRSAGFQPKAHARTAAEQRYETLRESPVPIA